jgi:microcystin-dependent protein
MTVPTTQSRVNYTGTGSTDTYEFPFRIFEDEDLLVIQRDDEGNEETLELDEDYTVNGAGEDTGSITLAAGNLPEDYSLTIRRKILIKQEADIRNQGSFFPEIHEDVFDRQAMAAQQHRDEIDRCMKMPETVPTDDFDPTLPPEVFLSPGVSVVVNDEGTGFAAGPSAGDISGAEANAQSAEASATAASASATAAAASETAAASSATAAAASATAAASSESQVSTDAAIAADKADEAASSAESAATSETNAGTSATNAAASASSASTSATNAANSATAAATSASNAATSETNAANSATAAEGSADDAETAKEAAEAALASVIATIGPVGAVLPFAGSSAPAGYLLCDGSAVSRTTYANLFTAIGTTHGEGDGSTTFNIPDYRGRFLRGVDGATSRDPDAASRTAMNTGGNTGDNVGSLQGYDGGNHTHGGGTGTANGSLSAQVFVNSSQNTNVRHRTITSWTSNDDASNGDTGASNDTGTRGAIVVGATATNNSYSSESRPINAYVNFIIKY